MASQTLTIRRPDDWHVHLRDGEMLQRWSRPSPRDSSRGRSSMPNLVPPITTVEAAIAYRERIVAAAGPGFTPLMTCYLTDDANADEIARGFEDGAWIAAKLYPAGATTNSASGVTDIRNIYPALERMEKIGMVLCVHGEVTDPDVDVFDREAVFIERVLSKLVKDFPGLKIVFEHITTEDAVEFVNRSSEGRGDDHAAPSPHQSERPVRRWPQAARLLPARRQAGEASPGSAQGRDFGLTQILPRHGQRATCARGQGIRLRLRRNFQRAVRARKLF